MKRYSIYFCEKIGDDLRWTTISTEEFETLGEAKKRFFAALATVEHSSHSVSFTLIDEHRLKHQIDDEEILSFTYIVD